MNTSDKFSVALFVPSCDKYFDVIDQFFERQEKFMGWWKYNRYVVTEQKSYKREGVISLCSYPSDAWSERMRKVLESLNEKYYLFLLDDYFICEDVNQGALINALKIMEEEDLRYYKLVNNPIIKHKCEKYDYLTPIPDNVRYGINLAECIVRKDFFLELLGEDGISVWQVEAKPLESITKKFSGYIPGCVADKRNIISIRYAIMKGMWAPATIKYFAKINIPIRLCDRSVLSFMYITRLKINNAVNKLLTPSIIRLLKKILSKIGFKFASQY